VLDDRSLAMALCAVQGPLSVANGAMLLEDARVLERHEPATEFDELGAESLVAIE